MLCVCGPLPRLTSHFFVLHGVQHNLVRMAGLHPTMPLRPIVGHSVGKDIPVATERRRRDWTGRGREIYNERVSLESMRRMRTKYVLFKRALASLSHIDIVPSEPWHSFSEENE